MTNIRIICVGKLKEKFYISAADEYLKRLSGYSKTEIKEVPEARRSGDSPSEIENCLLKEAEAIKTQIPSGTELFPYQTDGESFVDAKTDDEIFRIRVDTSVRPTTVNGIPEEECFENIMYAG